MSVLNNDCTGKNVCEGSETAGCYGWGEGGGYVPRLRPKSPKLGVVYQTYRNIHITLDNTSLSTAIWVCLAKFISNSNFREYSAERYALF